MLATKTPITEGMPALGGAASPPVKLRANCLNFSEVLAQAIALISPTMTAALIVPLMYGTAGAAGWLAFAFATVMLLFVALNLNQFARRFTSSGSMYEYTTKALGKTSGGLIGWCLVWAYMFIATAGMTGFTNFANVLLGMVHAHLPPIVLFALCAGTCWLLAYKDIQVSTILMLVLEGLSVALILGLAAMVLFRHGLPIDHAQLSLKGSSLSTMGLGVVIAIFSLVGFECATAFGDEAKQPLSTIPRAVIWSLMLTGVFFVIVTYMEVYGTHGYKTPLDQLSAPLNTLSELMGVPWLAVPISIGAMLSFFSLALSCINAGARILFPMGMHGHLSSSIGKVHTGNETPHIAVTIMSVLVFCIPTGMILSHIQVLDAFGYAGTFGAFGFLFSYFFISVAAPVYLKKIGELTPGAIALSVLAIVFLLVPAVGSVYPVPAPPVNKFPYIFMGYFVIGLIWMLVVRSREKATLPEGVHFATPPA